MASARPIEALLIVRELLERRKIKRFAVVCLPHLCEQWQEEIRAKLDLEAVIIRSNTQARLDRQIQGDTSVYDYYPYQVISIDFIKSDTRRDVFIEQCPELVIVDEAHTCARPTGASASQQQRYHLVSRIAQKPGQQLILLTATPHSGKPEEFHSLLGLLKPDFETLDLPSSTQTQRRELARFFVQRKRADVEKWMGEDTPFPKREAFEWPYDLSPGYARFFDEILDFARKLIAPDPGRGRQKRVQYWTALALLRGVMSSPAAGIEMLNTRLSNLASAAGDDAVTVTASDDESEDNPVRDTEFGFEGDNTPTQVVERNDWTSYQRQQLRHFAEQLEQLSTIKDDQKLASAELILEDWLDERFQPGGLLPLHCHGQLRRRATRAGAQEEIPEARPAGHHQRTARRSAQTAHRGDGQVAAARSHRHRLPERGHQPAGALHRRAALRPALEPEPPGAARGPCRPLRPDGPQR